LELRENNSFIPHQETRNHRLKRWNDWIKVSKTKLLFLLFHSLKSFSKPFWKYFSFIITTETLSFHKWEDKLFIQYCLSHSHVE
jgi:hypothetical protein